MNEPSDPKRDAEAQALVTTAFRRYIADRRARVAPFCKRHFSVSGAWRINRLALGHDLWKSPANVLWAGPYLLTRGIGTVISRFGWKGAAAKLSHLPPGFRTAVSREVEWLLYTDLLELPFHQETRTSSHDALLTSVLADEVIARLAEPELAELARISTDANCRSRLQDFLTEYTHSRTAAAELSSSILSLAAGASGYGQLTPGAIALGQATAGSIAQQVAVANFALGPALGGLYYSIFPAPASLGLVLSTVGGLMLALGTLTAFTGLITDPVQQALGLHERRLHHLLDAFEQELLGQRGSFALRDAYIARVFDFVDLLRAAIRSVVA